MYTLSSHWLLVIFTFDLIGNCDYFGFGFTTLNRKAFESTQFITSNPETKR